MTPPKQQTVAAGATFEGVGLHTGEMAQLRILPAESGTGIRFRRVDLEGSPEIPATLEHLVSTDRGTNLGVGEARVNTVEHLLAAAAGLGLDNLLIEIDGPEMPIGDGSFQPFVDVLLRAGIETQSEAAQVIKVSEPLSVDGPNGGRYVAYPGAGLRISTSIDFDHPSIGRQFRALELSQEEFERDIAGARTFGFKAEAEALHARGLALGATLENAIILDDSGIVSGSLRFEDEFVRHKIGDLVGDLSLIGARVQGHIVADRPSHAGNIELARAIQASSGKDQRPIVDIQQIMQYLPHRYPMLLVDRVTEFEAGKRIVGLKNVTINEPFFQGHYPGHPIMPGVLIIEAMAQVGGLLLMDAVENPEDKVVYFMSVDNVKWRRPVTPGDQLRFEIEMLQFRRHVCRMRGIGLVDGKVVAEADMMARIVER